MNKYLSLFHTTAKKTFACIKVLNRYVFKFHHKLSYCYLIAFLNISLHFLFMHPQNSVAAAPIIFLASLDFWEIIRQSHFSQFFSSTKDAFTSQMSLEFDEWVTRKPRGKKYFVKHFFKTQIWEINERGKFKEVRKEVVNRSQAI